MLWIAAAGAAGCLLLAGLVWSVRRQGRDKRDFGVISDQWIAQHRASTPHDPNR
jgi:hypothetical protein